MDTSKFKKQQTKITYLIEKFIIENLPFIEEDRIEDEFDFYMDNKKKEAFTKFVEEDNLNADKFNTLLENYLFSMRKPTKQELVETLATQPSIKVRNTIGETLLQKFQNFINTFFGQ